MFNSDPDPIHFFTIEKESTPSIMTSLKMTDGVTRVGAVLELVISNQKYEHKRKFYTFMTLVGDIGGFQGAIILLPAFLMSFYSPKRFEASIASEMPVKKKRMRQKAQRGGGSSECPESRF